jgi:hypothetical protein
MSESCPHCGASTSFSAQDARLLHGTCSACGVTSTIVQGAPGVELSMAPGTPAAPTHPGKGSAPEPSSAEGPPCPVCGTALVLRSWSANSVEADCTSCSSTTRYRAMREEGRPERFTPRAARGPELDERGPRGRPCRECGGPLTFSTDAEGTLTGECAQCGNRFTLPARQGFERRSGPPRDRGGGFRGGYAPRGRRPGGWGTGARPDRFRRGTGPPTRFRRRDDDADEDAGPERRRRRPRRE